MRDPAKGHYEQAYGDAVADATKATVADHSWVGSVTKTVFATAVLQQVAAGRLALMDTVQTLDPELAAKYPAVGALTVAQLLGMVSGIPDFADAAVAAVAADHAKSFTRDDDIALGLSLGTPKPAGTPGSTREYSWVRLPTAAPSAVRLALQLIGKPWDSEDTTFPAPSAVHSWFASTDWFCRSA